MTIRALDTYRVLDDVTSRLPGLGLNELEHDAALLDRVDRKYLVDADRLTAAVSAVAARVLDIDGARLFGYRSTYFDTPDLTSYHQAARRRPRRFKVRTRSYESTGACWVEAKLRDRCGRTVKERVVHDPGHETTLTQSAHSFLTGFDDIAGHLTLLDPTLTTSYHRATLVCGQRVTFDVGLTYSMPGGPPLATFGSDLVIAETKSAGCRPGPFDRALWRLGVRPTIVSKYCVGVAAAHPELPANKWHRVLDRHLERIPMPTRPTPPHVQIGDPR